MGVHFVFQELLTSNFISYGHLGVVRGGYVDLSLCGSNVLGVVCFLWRSSGAIY